MRTTITLSDSLLEQLKKRAAQSGTSVSKLIEQGVRLLMRSPVGGAGKKTTFELLTFGRGSNFTKRNIDKAHLILEDEDLNRFGRR